MELWYPPKDRPHLFEWWRPLVLASRAARLERVPWLVHVDDFALVGRVDRGSRPAIWVYRHAEARGELYLDATGQPYKFTRTPNAKALGRFSACDIRAAVWQARLPTAVEPVWFDEPRDAGVEWGGRSLRSEIDAEAAPVAGSQEPSGRQRGHLTVFDGGRPLAG